MKTRNCTLLCGALLAGLAGAAVRAQAPAELALTGYAATYQVKQGNLSAKLVMRLRQDGRWWRFESRSKPSGLLSMFSGAHASELSVLDTSGGELRPVAYNYTGGREPSDRDVASYFDWHSGKLISTRGERLLEAPMQAGTRDRLSVLLEIAAQLRDGRDRLSIPVAAKGRIRTKNYQVEPGARLRTAAGEFATVQVTELRPPGKRYTVSWFAPQHNYLPVRIDQFRDGKQRARIELQKVQWDAPAAGN